MFNEQLVKGLETGNYPCPRCKKPMVFEDEKWRDVLVCTDPTCGYSCNLDDYGKTDDEIENSYPTREEVLDCPDEDAEADDWCGETYEEVYDELD